MWRIVWIFYPWSCCSGHKRTRNLTELPSSTFTISIICFRLVVIIQYTSSLFATLIDSQDDFSMNFKWCSDWMMLLTPNIWERPAAHITWQSQLHAVLMSFQQVCVLIKGSHNLSDSNEDQWWDHCRCEQIQLLYILWYLPTMLFL